MKTSTTTIRSISMTLKAQQSRECIQKRITLCTTNTPTFSIPSTMRWFYILFSGRALNTIIHSSSAHSSTHLSLNGLSIILTKRGPFPKNSEVNTHWEDTRQGKKDVLLASCASLPALHEQSLLRVSLALTEVEEQLDTISIWQNAFTAGSAKQPALLTRLLKGQTINISP